MAWPCRARTYRGHLAEAQTAYVRVARAIAEFEPVGWVVDSMRLEEARTALGTGFRIEPMPLDDAWMRDIGPTFVTNSAGGLAGIDWHFNAWGDPNVPSSDDQRVAAELLRRLEVDRIVSPRVMEGGSFHVDGEGTLLTTEQCLLNPNRNPDQSREQIEAHLRAQLGVERIIWLGGGLRDDDTDGHVDNLACFARPGVVVALSSSDPDDDNYAALQDNLQRLRGARDARGRELEIHLIEQPPARFLEDGTRMSQSYINFYVANGGVVMPAFGTPDYDAAARATIESLFPDRQVAQVPATDIVAGGGGIHCITQQQPLSGSGPEESS
jgi:agmatine deiminase